MLLEISEINKVESWIKNKLTQGEKIMGSVVRAAQTGHIPNSINIDMNQNISDDGTFKNNEADERSTTATTT